MAGIHQVSPATFDQMPVRVALQCSEKDSRLILAEDNPSARLLSRPGEAIYNASGGLKEGDTLFQVAWLSEEDKESLLRKLTTKASTLEKLRPPPIVFEGNAPARVEDNRVLQALLSQPEWPERSRTVSAWLGQPIAIKEPIAARFFHQGGRNLLILGRDEEAAVGMLSAAVLSLAAQLAPEEARFYLIDLTSGHGDTAGLVKTLAKVLPHPTKLVQKRQVQDSIAEVADLVQQRLNQEHTGNPPIFMVGFGLQRFRDLRAEDEFAFSPSFENYENLDASDVPKQQVSLSQQFKTILQEGPDVGVYVLAWWDTYAALNRGIGRNLGEFGMRVALPMNNEESTHILDGPDAAKLGPHRAYFLDEENIGQMEKFIPYAPPSPHWLAQVGAEFKNKVTER